MLSDFFHTYEESLKNFLAEEQEDKNHSRHVIMYRYNNLKIYTDARKNPEPHFIVRIGISEAMYEIKTGEKVSGSLGPDERIIKRWIMRNLSKIHTNANAEEIKKKKTIKMSAADTENDDDN